MDAVDLAGSGHAVLGDAEAVGSAELTIRLPCWPKRVIYVEKAHNVFQPKFLGETKQ